MKMEHACQGRFPSKGRKGAECKGHFDSLFLAEVSIGRHSPLNSGRVPLPQAGGRGLLRMRIYSFHQMRPSDGGLWSSLKTFLFFVSPPTFFSPVHHYAHWIYMTPNSAVPSLARGSNRRERETQSCWWSWQWCLPALRGAWPGTTHLLLP